MISYSFGQNVRTETGKDSVLARRVDDSELSSWIILSERLTDPPNVRSYLLLSLSPHVDL